MKNQFAKLFNLGDYQVLVQTDFDNEKDMFLLVEATFFNGLHSTRSHYSRRERRRNEDFLAYDESRAQAFLTSIIATHKNLFDAN